jgi:hypothetical protein
MSLSLFLLKDRDSLSFLAGLALAWDFAGVFDVVEVERAFRTGDLSMRGIFFI